MTQIKTPAEKLGYKIGDKFEVNVSSSYDRGSIITFHYDDGTQNPLFVGEGTHFNLGPDRTPGAYVSLSKLTKIKPKVGDKFRVITEQCGFKVGTIVTLNQLSGNEDMAVFAGPNTRWQNARDKDGFRIDGAWMQFENVESYVEPETLIQEAYVDFLEGVSYKVGNQGMHSHWKFQEGDIIVATSVGLESSVGYNLAYPYPTMIFEVLGELEPETNIKPALEALKELQAYCHGVSVKAGWWNDVTTGEPFDPVAKGPEKIALMHSELSEALEGLRKGLMDDKLPHRPNAEVELADAVIRILDWAGAMGYDIAGAIGDKLEYNANREDHKLANRQAAGGKKF